MAAGSIVSRNLRLTAIRSFAAWWHCTTQRVRVATQIQAIPFKRTDTRMHKYLTREEMDAILDSIDRTRWRGRGVHALFLTLYNSGARVSEINALRQGHITFAGKSYVQLHGKGGKGAGRSIVATYRADF
jgi:integrase/recombinase XerD